MKEDELIKYSAEKIMGYEYSEEPPVSHTIQRGELKAGKEFASYSWPINPNGSLAERFICKSIPAKDWNPLSNAGAYQLDLIEAELVKLGFRICTSRPCLRDGYWITVDKISLVPTEGACDDAIEQIRACKLKAYVQAHKKWMEVQG